MHAHRSSHALLAVLLLVATVLLLAPAPAGADVVRVATLSDRGGDGVTVQARVERAAEATRRLLQFREDRGDADGARLVQRQASILRIYIQVQRDLQVLQRLRPRIDQPDLRERWP